MKPTNWDKADNVDDPFKGRSVGHYTDIIVTESGTVYIAYSDYDGTRGNLKLAHN